MRRTLLTIVLATGGALPLVAQSPTTSRGTASDTVKLGKYDLEITMEDGTMVGSLTVQREGGKFAAVVTAGGMTPAVKSFVREGAGYTLTAGHDNFSVVYTFKFVRDSVVGDVRVSSGQSGTVIGAYKP